MIVIPIEEDEETISSRFRKADMFVFIEKEKGIVIQENHFKTDKSTLFFENFKKYDVETLYVKELGFKTYLKLKDLGVEVYLIPEDVGIYTHINPAELVQLTSKNAELYCTLGHHNKGNS